jgi:acetoin utilization deacetylase AcuC-like enzyme
MAAWGWLQQQLVGFLRACCELVSCAPLSGGRAVFMLEGGYDVRALGESVANSFLALLEMDPQDKFNPAVRTLRASSF